jgi:hypothetical protein
MHFEYYWVDRRLFFSEYAGWDESDKESDSSDNFFYMDDY